MPRTNTLPFILVVCVMTGLLAQAPVTAPRQEPKAATWSDPSPHKSGFVTANGIRLNYLDWGGSGPTLILIHGYADNPHIFDDLAPAFTDRFRVIAYAQRGHGDSEAKEPFDTATLTEDLRGLMDALHISKAHLAGWSMAGNEITAMAGTHPERVDRLVYLEGAYDWGDPALALAFQSFPIELTPPPSALTSLDAFRTYQRSMWFPGLEDISRVEAYVRDLVVTQPDGSVRPKMTESVSQPLLHSLLTDRRDYTKVHAPTLAIYAETFADVHHGEPSQRIRNSDWEQKYLISFRAASMDRIRKEVSGVEIVNVPGTHMDFILTSQAQVVAAMRRFLGEPKTPAVQDTGSGPLIELSRPNALGSCNDFHGPAFANWPVEHAEEPVVAVNPMHPNNVVAAWMQGPAQGVVIAASFDGGQKWQRVPVPLTTCSGGPYLWAGDVWLSFSRNGDLYAVAVASNEKNFSNGRIAVSKSADGGLHWSAASWVSADNGLLPDHPSITADPTNPLFIYAIWDGNSEDSGGAVFTRTADGGVSWEAPRAMIHIADPKSWIQFSQILVLPNGALVNLYQSGESLPDKPPTSMQLQVRRSTDHGETWSDVINAVTMTPLYEPKGKTLVVDPKTGQPIQDPANPSFAVDHGNGNLYAVWGDGRFSNSQHNDIAFSMSRDGGLTWSAPVRVNKTPLNIPAKDRQAFHPCIAVARNGTIGVSYSDFRFNDTNPGLLTDRWLVRCHPTSIRAASVADCWGDEVRLTTSSFNMEAVVPIMPFGLFVGDYFGLESAGDDFVAVFAQPDDEKVTSIFARRIGH